MKGKIPPPVQSKKLLKTEQKAWNAQEYSTIKIPVEDVKDIKTAFDIFDTEGTGTVDPMDLVETLSCFEYKPHFIMGYSEDYQYPNGIDFAQFLHLVTAQIGQKSNRIEVDKVFHCFDINRCGKITTHELKKISVALGEKLTQEELNHMFQKADLDDDGFVTSDDFYNIITQKVYWER